MSYAWTAEQRREASIRQKKLWKNPTPAMRDGQSRRNLKQWTNSRRKKQSTYCIQQTISRWKDKDIRCRRRELKSFHAGRDRRWKRREEHEIQSERMKEQLRQWRRDGKIPFRISRPQRALLRKLKEEGIEGFKLEHPFGRYSLDVANKEFKICVELDGAYWHARNKTDYDARDKFLKEHGWKVKRFPATKAGVEKAFKWVDRVY